MSELLTSNPETLASNAEFVRAQFPLISALAYHSGNDLEQEAYALLEMAANLRWEALAHETGDELTDTQRVDFLEGWVKHSRERGFKWDTFTFNTDPAVTVREQIDQQIEVGMTEILKNRGAVKTTKALEQP